MSYEKDKIDSFVTSASLSTALAPYVTSNSLSAAIAGLDLAPYMTSNSISAAVVTDVLTVRGAASVSATLSAAAVTIAGLPSNSVLLGYQTLSGAAPVAGFSGSWSDIGFLELRVIYRNNGAGLTRPTINVFSDGGTTPFLSLDGVSVTAATSTMCEVNIYGGSGGGVKGINCTSPLTTGAGLTVYSTATLNTGIVNCVRFLTSVTVSVGVAILTGLRRV